MTETNFNRFIIKESERIFPKKEVKELLDEADYCIKNNFICNKSIFKKYNLRRTKSLNDIYSSSDTEKILISSDDIKNDIFGIIYNKICNKLTIDITEKINIKFLNEWYQKKVIEYTLSNIIISGIILKIKLIEDTLLLLNKLNDENIKEYFKKIKKNLKIIFKNETYPDIVNNFISKNLFKQIKIINLLTEINNNLINEKNNYMTLFNTKNILIFINIEKQFYLNFYTIFLKVLKWITYNKQTLLHKKYLFFPLIYDIKLNDSVIIYSCNIKILFNT